MEQTSDTQPHPSADRPRAGMHALEQENEALRIQAAAVAAQQAALMEDEIQLQHRRAALEQQEQQLATHLEEKRRRLIMLRDEAREAHAKLQQAQAAYEERVSQVMRDFAQSRQELADCQRQVQVERQRLLHLRQRLKRRFHRQWSSERMAMRLREAELLTQQRGLEKERERLQQERAGCMQARMQFNGEMELGQRQQQAEREQLRQIQAEVQERTSALNLREKSVQDGERTLAEEKQHWQAARSRLQQEVEGLDNRIANGRRILLDEQQKLDRLRGSSTQLPSHPGYPTPVLVALDQTPKAFSTALATPTGAELPHEPFHRLETVWRTRVARLQWVADGLADQRLYLEELYERLAQAQRQWQQERNLIATELEGLAQRVCQREETIQLREEAVAALEYRLDQRGAEIARQRAQLEGRSAQLATSAAIWGGDKEHLLVSLRAHEDLLAQQLTALSNLRQCWGKRRLRQVCRSRAAQAACGELRREAEALRLDYLRRSALLGKEQRALLERALALEQYRQCWIARAANPKAAEKRLERLRRRWAALAAAAERKLAQECKALETQAARLEERTGQLQQDADELVAREAEQAAREAAWEQKHLHDQREHAKIQHELNSLRRQRQAQEQQIATLREEIERLARVLLDDDPKPLPAARAA